MQNGQSSEVWRGVDGALFEPPVVSPDGLRVAIVVRQEGKRRLIEMASDGTSSRTLAPDVEIEGAAGQGAAAWSPDGKTIVAGGRDSRGPALFRISVDSGAAARLVEGKWSNPLWSPDGSLIVYAGRSVVGQVALLGVHPDGTPADLPQLLTRPGGYRFMPDGSGLVYLPRIQGVDFYMLDFATGKSRPLTALEDRGALRTFDITSDGASIVFDRSKQNSNIVLIDLAK
jgi:Tol biopolymer transport system component